VSDFAHPLLRRSLAAAYRFCDIFHAPFDRTTPPVTAPLTVTIPALRWTALPVDDDATYRFSASTLTEPAPSGGPLAIAVTSSDGSYVNFEPISVTLPLAVSSPPVRSDYLVVKPLWPTRLFRVPTGETALHGSIRSTTLPVAGLKVTMYATPSPPPGGPYTYTDARGDFLFRFPLLAAAGDTATLTIDVSDGSPVAISPSSIVLKLREIAMAQFNRV
jgi:hypothetical protein